MKKTLEKLILKSAKANSTHGFFGHYGYIGTSAFKFAETPEHQGECSKTLNSCEKFFALDIPLYSVDAKEFFHGVKMAKTTCAGERKERFLLQCEQGYVSIAALNDLEEARFSYVDFTKCDAGGRLLLDSRIVLLLKSKSVKIGFHVVGTVKFLKIETPEVTALVAEGGDEELAGRLTLQLLADGVEMADPEPAENNDIPEQEEDSPASRGEEFIVPGFSEDACNFIHTHLGTIMAENPEASTDEITALLEKRCAADGATGKWLDLPQQERDEATAGLYSHWKAKNQELTHEEEFAKLRNANNQAFKQGNDQVYNQSGLLLDTYFKDIQDKIKAETDAVLAERDKEDKGAAQRRNNQRRRAYLAHQIDVEYSLLEHYEHSHARTPEDRESTRRAIAEINSAINRMTRERNGIDDDGNVTEAHLDTLADGQAEAAKPPEAQTAPDDDFTLEPMKAGPLSPRARQFAALRIETEETPLALRLLAQTRQQHGPDQIPSTILCIDNIVYSRLRSIGCSKNQTRQWTDLIVGRILDKDIETAGKPEAEAIPNYEYNHDATTKEVYKEAA